VISDAFHPIPSHFLFLMVIDVIVITAVVGHWPEILSFIFTLWLVA
jgi:hypothetical protein